MSHRGKRAIVAIALAATVFALGATSAWGAPSGIVRPFVSGGAKAQSSHFQTGALGSSTVGRGSPSPYCSPGPPAAPACVPPLIYFGAPVMHGVTTHVIAWGAPSAFPSGYVSGFETFLGDVAHDLGHSGNISSVATQYVDANGTALSSLTSPTAISDTNPYPTSGNCAVSGVTVCLTEAQLLAEVTNVIAGQSLPVNVNQSYIVLLPPQVDSCIDSSSSTCEAESFCGYHDTFNVGSAETTFTLLPYTESSYSNSGGGSCYDPTVTYPASSSSDVMALDSIGAHELMESVTDPVVGFGYLDANGWEIGDECAWIYGTTHAATGGGVYNQLINGHQYLTQMMWSDQDNACVQGDASTPTASIGTGGAQATPGVAKGLTATLHGDSAGAATYAWSYENASGITSTNVASGANPQIAFASPGTYTVWVTITDNAGGTVIGVSNVTVDLPPTAGFTSSTANPNTVTSVNFTPTGTSAGTGAIASYSWNFGDGTTSTASNPSHTFTSAGNYTVTLSVTQTDGLTASVQHAETVTVLPPTTGWLKSALALTGGQLRIRSVLKTGGEMIKVGSTTESGTLILTWSAMVKHRKTVVARGSASLVAGAVGHVQIKLTGAGRKLLRKAKRVKITVTGEYEFPGSTITVVRTVTLRR